ncbi:MAG TPA: FAD-dependent oxidoreductase [Candidatus Saccharicenans sp.]|nr:FAD-dependent oxidoreductase [Candidatus Saccharicenans sp.]
MENKRDFSQLLSPFSIKGVELKNRVVFLPHEPYYGSEDHLPTKKHQFYYEERARGGVALIVMPSLGVHPSGYYACQVAAREESLPRLKEITATVHSYGTKIFAQLTHYGNQTKSVETLQPTWAPSAIPDMTVREIPKEMTKEEIITLVKAFGQAAQLLMRANFDGFEIKVAHDGILRQFLSPAKNSRKDEYGGSLQNRARIVIEVLKEVRQYLGDKPLGLRLCLDEFIPNGYSIDDAIEYAKLFNPFVDYINSDFGTWESMAYSLPSLNFEQGFHLKAIARVKKAVTVPVIASGRIIQPAMAEQVLESGTADLIGLARGLVAEPYWVKKIEAGEIEEISECIGCNQKCVGRLLQNRAISCVVNPASGFEENYSRQVIYSRSSSPQKVVIAGGGPAGMKAAELAARKGHQVVLLEKSDSLGGRVKLESSLPGKKELAGTARYLTSALTNLNVDVRLNTEATEDKILAEKPDIVIIATGASRLNNPGTYSIEDVLNHKVKGENALVMDYDAGLEGTGAVEYLASQGKTVHWVTAVFFNGQDNEVSTVLLPIYGRLGTKKVITHPMSVMVKFDNGQATLLNPYFNRTEILSGIEAVVVTGLKAANNALYAALKDKVANLHLIGDAAAPRDTAAALADALTLSAYL